MSFLLVLAMVFLVVVPLSIAGLAFRWQQDHCRWRQSSEAPKPLQELAPRGVAGLRRRLQSIYIHIGRLPPRV